MPIGTVTVYMHGMPSQKVKLKLLRIERGLAVTEGSSVPEAYYRLTDGRRCDIGGAPYPWNFWRLSLEDCEKIRKEHGKGTR